jgi:hypothetical protein
MPLPIFPATAFAPGDGRLVSLTAGLQQRPLGGLVLELLVLECRDADDLLLDPGTGRFGEPLLRVGTTLWLRGVLQADLYGEPAAADFADVRDDWLELRALLLGHDAVDVHVYAPPAPATPVVVPALRFVIVRGWWHDPGGLRYELGACAPTLHLE